jgi:hypothetical protein
MDSIDLDIEKGDVILTGKFKNKRQVVKDFGTDDLGQPTINGMKALKFRIEKLMPKEKWSKKSKEEAEEVNEMKITKRQLRRIIREQWDNEQWNRTGANWEDDPYEDRFDDDQKDMDYYLAVAIEKSVRDNAGIGGLDLVDLVKQDSLFGGTTRDDIFNMLDKMIEDGTLWGDFEEDAWYLASDTPHGRTY